MLSMISMFYTASNVLMTSYKGPFTGWCVRFLVRFLVAPIRSMNKKKRVRKG